MNPLDHSESSILRSPFRRLSHEILLSSVLDALSRVDIVVMALLHAVLALATAVAPADEEAAAYEAVKQQAFRKALKQQQAVAGNNALDDEVFRVVNYRMAAHYFAGACVRDFASACPSGWTETPVDGKGPASLTCFPPVDYQGPCKAEGATLHRMASPESKAEIATVCEAEWPCKVCRKRYDTCPHSWTSAGDVCKAPRDYEGVCEKSVDFRNMTDFHKARWAARCAAVWPCDPRPVILQELDK